MCSRIESRALYIPNKCSTTEARNCILKSYENIPSTIHSWLLQKANLLLRSMLRIWEEGFLQWTVACSWAEQRWLLCCLVSEMRWDQYTLSCPELSLGALPSEWPDGMEKLDFLSLHSGAAFPGRPQPGTTVWPAPPTSYVSLEGLAMFCLQKAISVIFQLWVKLLYISVWCGCNSSICVYVNTTKYSKTVIF